MKEKPSSLKVEHPTLETKEKFLNFSYFCGSFCLPGSGFSQHKKSQCGSGSTTLASAMHFIYIKGASSQP
jgi:hypothetical protein